MILAAIVSISCIVPAFAQNSGTETGAEAMGSTRDALTRWVETQQIISRETRDWQIGKEVLEQRIELIGDEIAGLEEKISTARSSIRDADNERSKLDSENGSLKRASGALEESIGPLEGKTRSLLRMLPDPIREKVAPLSHRIPSDPENTGLSLGERYQNVIGILNEVNKFNGDISVHSELREIADGKSAEVKTLYLGLGQAYYVTPGGESAGIGRPTPDGWEWIPADELAPQVNRVIDILMNGKVPAYVPLPVEIR
jgi:hypothetical protein